MIKMDDEQFIELLYESLSYFYDLEKWEYQETMQAIVHRGFEASDLNKENPCWNGIDDEGTGAKHRPVEYWNNLIDKVLEDKEVL